MSARWRNVIVVPCYNEAARLDEAAFAGFARANPDTKFLFVDDGSSDETEPVLRTLVAKLGAQADVLGLDHNRGKAEAVRAGMEAALDEGPSYAGYWDADLSTPLDVIPRFAAILDERPEVLMVLGARVRLLGRTIRRSALRHYAGRVFATAASVALRLAVYDTQCGAKLFRATPAMRALFGEPFISRWAFDVEIIARILRDQPDHRNLSVEAREAPFYELSLWQWEDIAGSNVRALDFPRSMLDLLRIRQRYLR